MDAKEELLVRDLYRRVKTYKFHERDVLTLLILLRQHCGSNSPVRELSDFVAHRERDRGTLKTYMQAVPKYCEAVLANKAASVEIRAVHSNAAFGDSLNTTLAKFNLPPLSLEMTNDLLTCVLSLLQEVQLFHMGAKIGQLALGRFRKDLWLLGAITMPGPKKIPVIFPALVVPNKYCSPGEENKLGAFSGLVEAKCTKGRLWLWVGRRAAV